jgi:hypothetical protein
VNGPQQPPLQGPPLDTQNGWHCWPSQLDPAGQSAAVVQPQPPFTHTWPATLVLQSRHALPLPHAPAVVPAWHLPSTPQQLRLQPEPHATTHSCLVRSQEVGGNDVQLVALMQPHEPPPVPGTQALPMVSLAQFRQEAPSLPQSPGARPVTQMGVGSEKSQQPPLQSAP